MEMETGNILFKSDFYNDIYIIIIKIILHAHPLNISDFIVFSKKCRNNSCGVKALHFITIMLSCFSVSMVRPFVKFSIEKY